jgi:hypothetical protein
VCVKEGHKTEKRKTKERDLLRGKKLKEKEERN